MIRYLNTKINGETETITFVDFNKFKSVRDARKEMNRLIIEYNKAGNHGSLYWSQRKCKGY